ncbi:hypothetical protein [Bacillus phage FI_KG-Lek]|nr:hypothetical protein [Bacillus phage FI_KG-Lek]
MYKRYLKRFISGKESRKLNRSIISGRENK